MRSNLSAKFKAQSGEWVLPQSPSGEIWGVNLNSLACDERDEIEIYAASAARYDAAARRRPARGEALTASLSRKILSAPFRSEVSSEKFRALKF